MGMDQFILRRIDSREISNQDNNPVINAFNKMHAGERVAVEWGIRMKGNFLKFMSECQRQYK